MTKDALKNTHFTLKTWFVLWGLSILVFSPFIINFSFGNHDWAWIKEETPLWSGLFEGRYSQFFLQTVLFEKKIFPILTHFTAFAFLSLASILLLRLLELPLKKIYYIVLGINIICAPFTISWLYFAFIILSIFFWILAIVLSYYLLNKPTPLYSLKSITALCLFTLALGGYPPIINFIGFMLFSLIIKDLCLHNLSIKEILKKYLPHAIIIALSLIIFVCIHHLLLKYHLEYNTYNTSNITFEEILPKLKLCLIAFFEQFINTTSFIPKSYKILNLILVISAFFYLFTQLEKTPQKILFFLLCICGLSFSTITTLFLSNSTQYILHAPRISFFGLVYFYIFSGCILLKTPHKFIRNLSLCILLLLSLFNIKNINYAGKVWQFGFKAETLFMERFLLRVETNERFSPHKHTFVQGGTLDFRSRYYLPDKSAANSYILTAPYIPWHLPSKAYKFYYSEDIFGNDFDIFWQHVDRRLIPMSPELKKYLQYDSFAWPDKDAIYIDDNIIVLTLTPNGKQAAINWLKNNP